MGDNLLFYGDNLDVLRRHIKDESVDLVYLDPPFNSARNYNVLFDAKDVSQLDLVEAFDFITTFDAIHDQAHPDRVLRGIRQALRRGGIYLCVDIAASSDLAKNITNPLGPLISPISTMHCMTVSLAMGGAGLGTAWGHELALEMLAAAGFSRVDVREVEGDIFNYYYVAYPT